MAGEDQRSPEKGHAVNRYRARSASEKQGDRYPFWYVEDTWHGINATVVLMPEMRGFLPFLPKPDAVALAEKANATP